MLKLLITLFPILVFSGPVLTAHKGSWKDHIYPQNSLQSLKKAVYEKKFKAIEFDVLLSGDKKLILAHDQKLDKLTNCSGNIKDKNTDYLLNCMIEKNTLLPVTLLLNKKVAKPQALVTIDKTLSTFQDSELELIWVDLKDNTIEAAESLLQTIQNGNFSEHFVRSIVVNTTNIEVLKFIKAHNPSIGRSIEGKWGAEPLVDLDYYLGDKVLPFITHLSLNLGIRLGDESLLRILGKKKRFNSRFENLLRLSHFYGIKVIGWTVNNKKKIKRLSEYKLDFLLTDRIDLKQ